jgi:hypothetical protein
MAAMLDQLRRLGRQPLHPFLAATYPVVLLWAQNLRELIPPTDVAGPLALALAGAAVAFVAWWAILRDTQRAALLTTFVVALFFGYGQVWEAFGRQEVGHAPLLAGWAVLGFGGIVLLILFGARIAAVTPLLNLVLAGLVAVNVMSIAAFGIQVRAAQAPSQAETPVSPRPGTPTATPDIYWIILDRYGSADVLETYYDHDLTPFIQALEDRGLYVAEHATANYLKTAPSLVSARDMDYLDGDGLRARAVADDDWGPLYSDLADRFALLDLLEPYGYRFVHLGTWWGPTQTHPEAEFNFAYDGHTSEFAHALERSTLLRGLEVSGESVVDPRRPFYDRNRWQWERINEAIAIGGPKFVHAHFSLPHEPFVFDVDGSYVTLDRERSRGRVESYARQVEYANTEVLRFIDRALDTDPEQRPILVIQSEEGPRPARYAANETDFDWTDATDEELHEKFGILSAYYLPGYPGAEAVAVGLYPSITLVNQFRVIANAYLGTDFEILPDRNFIWPDDQNMYELIDVTDRVQRMVGGGD